MLLITHLCTPASSKVSLCCSNTFILCLNIFACFKFMLLVFNACCASSRWLGFLVSLNNAMARCAACWFASRRRSSSDKSYNCINANKTETTCDSRLILCKNVMQTLDRLLEIWSVAEEISFSRA